MQCTAPVQVFPQRDSALTGLVHYGLTQSRNSPSQGHDAPETQPVLVPILKDTRRVIRNRLPHSSYRVYLVVFGVVVGVDLGGGWLTGRLSEMGPLASHVAMQAT